jgi:hypothetical protein
MYKINYISKKENQSYKYKFIKSNIYKLKIIFEVLFKNIFWNVIYLIESTREPNEPNYMQLKLNSFT